MHPRQRLLLNAILFVTAALLAWRLGAEWKRANLRYAEAGEQTAALSALSVPNLPESAVPSGETIVAGNLFTPDRSSFTTQAETTLPSAALPVVFGTMNLGNSYEALMAEGGKASSRAFRRVKSGERVGSYTVVEIHDEKVVLDYQGQRTTLDVYQSANSVPRPPQRTTPAAAPVVETVASPPPPAPRPAAGARSAASAGAAAVQGVPPGTRVTVEGNRRRYERQTAFGPQIWYENIEQ